MATPQNAANFFRQIGLKTNQVKNAIIVGGGTISVYLSLALLDMKIDVKVIEKDRARCEELSEQIPQATIICGDGTDSELLMEEGLADAESFVALTNMDEENVFLVESNFRKNEIYDNRTVPVICRQYICASTGNSER